MVPIGSLPVHYFVNSLYFRQNSEIFYSKKLVFLCLFHQLLFNARLFNARLFNAMFVQPPWLFNSHDCSTPRLFNRNDCSTQIFLTLCLYNVHVCSTTWLFNVISNDMFVQRHRCMSWLFTVTDVQCHLSSTIISFNLFVLYLNKCKSVRLG